MKKVYYFFFVSFLASSLSYAQGIDSTYLQVLKTMRDARVADIADIDALFSTKTLPSEWDKASAVILVHYSKYYVETQDGKPAFGAYSKTRVLLNDAFAVNDFSSFTLDEDEWLEVKVIKKDGKVIELDPSRAVKGDVRVVNRKKKLDFSF